MGGKWKKHKAAEEARRLAEQPAQGTTDHANHMDVDTAPAEQQPVQQQAPAVAIVPEVVHAAPAHVPAQPKQKSKRPAPQLANGHQQPTTTAQASNRATLSIAVPGSIIEHAGTPEVAAAVAAQIARAAAIFSVDEVVVYNDSGSAASNTVSVATATLARLLQFLETPAHLRASLFPGSVAYPELRVAEALCPSLQTPHHQRSQEWQQYREGVVMRSEAGMGSFIDIGYDRNAHVDATVPVGRRVTLYVGPAPRVEFVPAFSETMLKATVVSPSEPRQKAGQYWGYSVRLATSLSKALKEGPHKSYDLLVGTSPEGVEREVAELVLPKFKHALVLFGGVKGLEDLFLEDEALAQSGKSPSDVCGVYLNCCPNQGVAEIRTEDAVPVCLAYLHASMLKYGSR